MLCTCGHFPFKHYKLVGSCGECGCMKFKEKILEAKTIDILARKEGFAQEAQG